MINREFISRKITLIQKELSHLKDYQGLAFDAIAGSYEKLATVERALERIINRAIDVNNHLIAELATAKTATPLEYADTFRSLVSLNIYPAAFANDIAKSVGTRNLLVHEYDSVDTKQVYTSIDDALRDYSAYCSYLLDFLEKMPVK